MAALSASELRKTYAGNEVVAGLSFVVEPGTCFGLLGPNGAGKTTTLRLCLGLTGPDSGDIVLNGHAIPDDAQAARARQEIASARAAGAQPPAHCTAEAAALGG